MAKISFPTPTTGKQYAGVITRLRYALLATATSIDRRADAKVDIGATVNAFLAATGIAAPVAPATPPLGYYNSSTGQYTKWQAGVARVIAGTGRALWLCAGDSTTWGEGGGDSGGNLRVNAKAFCWPTIAAQKLATLGIPASYDSLFASGANTTVTAITDFLNSYKTGFTYTGTGWGFSSSTTVGGCLFTNTTDTTSQLQITTQVANEFELFDIVSTTGGSISYNIDGGADVTLNQNGANAFRSTKIALGTVAVHTINIKRVSGNAFFLGYIARNLTVPAVDVVNLGRGSSTTTDWITSANPWSPLPALTTMAAGADLVSLSFTINDALGNVADSVYNANIQTIDAAVSAGGASVLYATGNPSAIGTIPDVQQQRIRTDLQVKAVANNRGMLDMFAKYTSHAEMSNRGWTYNANHLNKYGYYTTGLFYAEFAKAMSGTA